MKLRTLTVIVSSALVTSLILIGGAAWAMAESNNIINACVAKDGSLSVVALQGQCKDKETPLDWNIQGVPGEQGEQGTQGEQGIQGEQGPPGPSGIVGFYQRKATLANCSHPADCPPMSEPLIASCDPGDAATGGSGHIFRTGATWQYEDRISIPWPPDINQPPTGWAIPLGPESVWPALQVIVICADMTP